MAVAMLMAGCQKEADSLITPTENPNGSICFSGGNLLKATGSEWELNDAIGITMASEANTAYASNQHYTTTGSGTHVDFSPAAASNQLFYPKDGSAVNFYAYYPYSSTFNGTISLLDQSGDSKKLDFMVASVLKKTEGAVSFGFRHRLAQVTFNLTAGGTDVANFEGEVSATLSGMSSKGEYSFANDSFGKLATDNIALKISVNASDKTRATIQALVIPDEGATGAAGRKLTIAIGGARYAFAIAESKAFKAGEHYTYNVTVGK